MRPGIPLAEKLGRIFTALAGALPTTLDVEVRGDITQHDVGVLELAALKGVFRDVVEGSVSYVNAPVLAADRGVQVRLVTDPVSEDFRNVVALRGALADGSQVSVAGTLTGPKQTEKIVGVDDVELEVSLSEHMAFFRYTDRPGVIGVMGRLLGDAGVNIAGMQVGRDHEGGAAVVALTVDSAIPAGVLAEIAAAIGAQTARVVDLSDEPPG